MCLIVFAYKYHPQYPLILAGNRDEFHQRPTQKLHVWDGDPKILAGKDLKAGGTWLGINQHGKFAAVTNYRDLSNIKKNAPSRGSIVTEILNSDLSTKEKLSDMAPDFSKYNGFNLIAGTVDDLYYGSNHDHSFQKIKPGLYGISNASLNTPWPKTNSALENFSTVLNNGQPDSNEIFDLLSDTNRYPKEMLPKTGLSPEMEKAVSSVFILTEDYGTRSSALLFFDKSGNVKFTEKTYSPGTTEVTNTEEFHLNLKEKQFHKL
tara:strand:- start:39468 stop:40256 length:789 start_codon:yes stop_codon:yes gene_type:complete